MRNVAKVVVSAGLWCAVAALDGGDSRAEAAYWHFYHARHHHRNDYSRQRHNYHWQNWETYRSHYRSSRSPRGSALR